MCLLKNSVIIEIIKNTILINQELVNKLTKREFKVALLMIMGETSGSIFKKLMINPNIVLHIKNRYKFIYTYL
jgi:DNA-binding CsgD family transcriptional regulator